MRFIGGRFFAADSLGIEKPLASTDGTNWIALSGPIPEIFDHGVYLTLSGRQSFTSTNGLDWTIHETLDTNHFFSGLVVSGSGAFVALVSEITRAPDDNADDLFYSTDGISWSPSLHEPFVNVAGSQQLAYGDGVFVASNPVAGTVYYSRDGRNWQPGGDEYLWIFQPHFTDAEGKPIFYGFDSSGVLLYSYDQSSWTLTGASDVEFAPPASFNIIQGGDRYICYGAKGNTLFSQGGKSWTNLSTGSIYASSDGNHALVFTAAAYGAAGYVAVAALGFVANSLDGTYWTNQTSATPLALNDVAYGNGEYLAVGVSGAMVSSSDGINWADNSSSSADSLNAVVFGAGKFVAVGSHGLLWNSDSGFVSAIGAGGETFSAVTFGQGEFVAISSTGNIWVSPDGATWQKGSFAGAPQLNGICYGNNLFVAVGNGGAIRWSTNLTAWTGTNIASSLFLHRVSFANGIFVAVGKSGTILSSTNGFDWIAERRVTGFDLNDIIYANGKFMAVGDRATVLQSDAVLPTPPIITMQPVGATNLVSETEIFTVAASGSEPLIFQWQRGGSPILSATNSSLTLTNLQITDSGLYNVTVINDFGSAESQDAALVVESLADVKPKLSIRAGLTLERSITGKVGRVYRIESVDSLPAGNGWLPVTSFKLITSPQIWTDPTVGVSSTRFYRAVLIQ